ncbi:unnamed protein product [Didymodactylos carnosus]|uniref:MACPF domain-containing protein n=1 Tax=Didymodactylos carnosus TaxID=1234261 RepID=A0A814MYD0_9BILA|nr:unnamed protein product [Didymodactylos carnosus]CAF1084793.1 unnamed protein product [Didymodactylos carnosus]CAF3666121.1 unnamed protein product [Didymodactylos carnosus]CAF3850472.1 unnamed protein product [Didymodactylos carnosus]
MSLLLLLSLCFVSLISVSYEDGDIFNLKSARTALCPIVGFHGIFCPGDASSGSPTGKKLKQSISAQQPVELPNSVGMAIDISTGELLLPVLKLSKGSKQWTDKESGKIFLVPPELTLRESLSNNEENKVIVRIFQTENDLVDIWLKNAEAGGWTGGQLANVQNISDVYKTYFFDDQVMAITQQFKVLYTVSFTDSQNLELNKYAQGAVDVLTYDFDENLYQSFLDAWGTHVTVSTTVGGMNEQQTLLKSCILHTTDVSDGLTKTVLEENLKQELLEKQPCIDLYYYLRRKRYLDHRIGGNILLINNNTVDTDDNQWKKTIIQDPALLLVEKFVPWYDLVQNKRIKQNLKQAVDLRINRVSLIRQQQVQQIRDERRRMVLKAKVLLQTNSYEWNVGGDIELKTADTCTTLLDNTQLAAKCGTGTMMSSCALALTDNIEKNIYIETGKVPVCYERNNVTGAFRLVARRQYGRTNDTIRTGFQNFDVNGEWMESGGCSKISDKCDLYSGSDDVYLCSGCNVQCETNQNQRQVNCKCSCPTYPVDPEAKPYLRYC